MFVEADDYRQIYVIAKNEIRKLIRGKRFLIYVLLAVVIFSLISFLPYALGEHWESTTMFLAAHFTFTSIFVVIAVTLFTSSTYVSEFEERTALILFTRPVKKTTIFVGKFVGCFILEAVVLLGYYAAMAVATFPFFDDSPTMGQYLTSFGCIMLYLFAASGVAALFSVIMKKAGTSAIMTFVTVLLLISIVSGVIFFATSEFPWYMLDQAANSIYAAIPSIAVSLDVTDLDVAKAMLTMIVWGAVTVFLSWFIFTKKEM